MIDLRSFQQEHNGDPIGRLVIEDERDSLFRAQPRITDEEGSDALERGWRYWWQDGWWGDQFYTPQCVAYAWTHLLEDGPITHEDKTPGRIAVHGQGAAIIDPNEGYAWMQRNDYWEGENYDGTSVRAGAKYLRELGYIDGFEWIYDLDTAVETILLDGPFVFGSVWTEDMSNPDESGMINITGNVVGGHAYVINGVNIKDRIFRMKNSWGRKNFGIRGNAAIRFEDFDELLKNDGEACVPVLAA